MADAVYYDGETAKRRLVSFLFTASDLELYEEGGRVAAWPYHSVRRQEAPADHLRLSAEGAPPLARLEVLRTEDQEAIRIRCVRLDKGDGSERTGRIVFWSLAAAASLVFSALVLVPVLAERLAPLVPLSIEQRLGTAVDNQVKLLLGGKTCEAPAGRLALDKLAARLVTVTSSEVPPHIAVLSSSIPNAIALPGGRIYLFDGLLREAESADEAAGVLAHEIGHVAHRDGLRTLIQTGGTSFLLGLLFGDVTGSSTIILVSRLAIDGSYSRDAERSADAYAMKAMLALGRPPEALGRLLKRIDDGDRSIPAFLSSHPLTDERLDALSREAPMQGDPLLTEEEWRALKDICKAE